MYKRVHECSEAALFITFRSQGLRSPFSGDKAAANVLQILNGAKSQRPSPGPWVHVAIITHSMSGSGHEKTGMVFYNTTFAEKCGFNVKWLKEFSVKVGGWVGERIHLSA